MKRRIHHVGPTGCDDLHVGLTGARAGDVLLGKRDADQVMLKISQGTVYGSGYFSKGVEKQVLVCKLAKRMGVSHSQALLAYGDLPIKQDAPNHLPIGSGCGHPVNDGCNCDSTASFVVLSQGKWQQWADEHGNGSLLERIVAERMVVTWRDVINLMHTPGKPGGKLLAARSSIFEVMTGPFQVSDTVACDWVDARLGEACGQLFDMGSHVIRLPPPGVMADVPNIALEALRHIGVEGDVETWVHCTSECIAPLTAGGLKSLLQKCMRMHAVSVDLGPLVPTAVVAVVVFLTLAADKGSFSPELQLFTRGCTSAFKRLAVILLEDTFVPEADVAGLLAVALGCHRIHDYNPSRESLIHAAVLAGRGVESDVLIAWRDRPTETIGCSPETAHGLTRAAELLRVLRSFEGDMVMFESVAQMARTGVLGLVRCELRPQVMPIWHMFDQHAYRGIAHIMRTGATFADRFKSVFTDCTGLNPRQRSLGDLEQRIVVQEIRFAQRCIGAFALCKSTVQIAQTGSHVELAVELDPGTLAAGVGPIKVTVGKMRLIVLLGVDTPEDEVVMRPPTRDPRDLFNVQPEQRASAVAQVRAMELRVQSPLLQGVARFVDGTWHLGNHKWSDVVQQGGQLTVPVSTGFVAVMSAPEDQIELCLRSTGDGMVYDAREQITNLAAQSIDVALRAHALLKQQWVKVRLPTPSLDGRLGSDQLAAYAGDWDVWRLLVLVSRLVPGALRPVMPPNFEVRNARLLRLVEAWILSGTRRRQMSLQNLWCTHPRWVHLDLEPSLMEHQRAAVERMTLRDAASDTGHFLVMDTGLGKTVTSLAYALRWLRAHGERVDYLLWVTPNGTTTSLQVQLANIWKVPVHMVPRVSAVKPGKLQLVKHYVNVIHADHLRTAIERGLSEAASSCLVVFDEVDELYSPTLRTSAARMVAHLCPKFVAQTATPMRNTESELQMWLGDTCAFPVTSSNMLVAASAMVCMQLELEIQAVEELVLVPMSDIVRSRCRNLLDTMAWQQMADLVQQHTDARMVERAVELARLDRVLHPAGGVLLVSDSLAHADRLIRACSVHVRTGSFESLEAADAAEHAIVVVTKHVVRGYNSACRLGILVTGVYAGNAAARHQVRGRIRRIGQERSQVTFVTVVMENSILQLLHERHGSIDCMNMSLEQLGQRFATEFLTPLLKF